MQNTKTRLTDAQVRIAALPDGKTEAVLWDADVAGFGLRLRGKSKTFIVSYRPAGSGRTVNAKRFKLGTPESIGSVKDARRMARAALGQIAAGGDPLAERKEEQRRAGATVGALLDRYDAHLGRRGYVNRTDVLKFLRRYLAPLSRREISDVKAWEIAEILEKLDRGGPKSAATAFRSRCSPFLNWCAFEARVIDANPLAGYRRRNTRAERVRKEERGRALSDVELAAVWRAAGDAGVFGLLVRYLILTGCRRSEGAKLVWPMVNLERGRIDLPKTFTKQARGHTVYIAPELSQVLAAFEIDARNPDQVFASPRTGGPMSGWSKIMDPNDRRTLGGTTARTPGFVKACGVDFTLHDLRRTFRTGLSRLGVDREIAELALGHAREDLEARYNRDDCEAALREAFTLWGQHVASVCAEPRETVFD